MRFGQLRFYRHAKSPIFLSCNAARGKARPDPNLLAVSASAICCRVPMLV
jgi:hypothetical protein